jgi:hypothetical protein
MVPLPVVCLFLALSVAAAEDDIVLQKFGSVLLAFVSTCPLVAASFVS